MRHRKSSGTFVAISRVYSQGLPLSKAVSRCVPKAEDERNTVSPVYSVSTCRRPLP
jgi:hypothetical protein